MNTSCSFHRFSHFSRRRLVLDKHHYDAAALTCVDGLWIPKFMGVAYRLGGKLVDIHSWPGSIKEFNNNSPTARLLLGNIVRVSIGLHGIKNLLLFSHWNCGAYGGSRAFESPMSEEDAYFCDLRQAQKYIADTIPSVISEQLSIGSLGVHQSENLNIALSDGLDIKAIMLRPRHHQDMATVQPKDCYPLIIID